MKKVGITTSIATGDLCPEYGFFVYDEVADENIIIDLEELYRKPKRKRRLGPQDLDRMSREEIEDWYERNGTGYGYEY